MEAKKLKNANWRAVCGVCPYGVPSKATDRVRFTLEGPGRLVAVGNGNPRAHESFADARSHPLYFGKAIAVVRRTGPGTIRLTASVQGLRPAELEIK